MNKFTTIRNALQRIDAYSPMFLHTLRSKKPEITTEVAHAYPGSMLHTFNQNTENMRIPWEKVPANEIAKMHIQIPWCKMKCLYCRYPDSIKREISEAVFDRFIRALNKEFELYKEKLGLTVLVIDQLYIGGGTPSIFSPKQLESFFDVLTTHTKFEQGAHIVTEISPGTLSKEKMQIYSDVGITRMSVGVQTFNEQVLKACGRVRENAQVVNEAYNLIRKFGIPEINIDLMPGLLQQTLEIFFDDLLEVLKLKPSSVSFLDMEVWPNSFLYKSGYRNTFFKWNQQVVMRALYQDVMEHAGYISTRPHYYVKPDEMRHRSARVVCTDMRYFGLQLGLGPGAISHVGDMIYRNVNIEQYPELLEQDRQFPIEKFLRLSETIWRSMNIIKSLVDEKILLPMAREYYPHEISFLQEHELLSENFELTRDGSLFGSEVMYQFYPKEIGKAS